MSYINSLAVRLKAAMPEISLATSKKKNEILNAVANAFENGKAEIIKANEDDLDQAAQNGVSAIMLDRLMLNEERIRAFAQGVRNVARLNDPIGQVISGSILLNGLEVVQKRVPLGCVGMIYESRPNVTADAAALCLKTGNAVMLRGGKEAIHTNTAIVKLMQSAVAECGVSPDIILLVEDSSREASIEMMKLNGYLDVLIPRGGAGLIQAVTQNATIPTIETGVGNCHIYVDKEANLKMASDIVFNAKTSRPSVCNACESLLVHETVAEKFLPILRDRLACKNVILLGCPKTRSILGNSIAIATEDDYRTEFLDYVLSIKVVKNVDEAVCHINKYSTKHSEAIITNDLNAADEFTSRVDSAVVYVNASTRFTDGNEFGLGAEIGISTQKLHVRGPMGLEALTSTKYIVHGSGHVRT